MNQYIITYTLEGKTNKVEFICKPRGLKMKMSAFFWEQFGKTGKALKWISKKTNSLKDWSNDPDFA